MRWMIAFGLIFLGAANASTLQQPTILYFYIGIEGGGYEDAKITLYSNKTYKFDHSGDCCCGTHIEDAGSWKENRKGVFLLNSDQKIKDLDCKKRKVFRNFKIDPQKGVIQVPGRIYGYRTMRRFIPSNN